MGRRVIFQFSRLWLSDLFVPGSIIPLKCRDGPSCHEEKLSCDVICLNLRPTSFLSTCCFETSNAII